MNAQPALPFKYGQPEITAVQTGSGWKLTGETYFRRRTLARAGLKWNAEEKVWTMSGENLPAEIATMVTTWELAKPSSEPEAQPAAEPVAEPVVEPEQQLEQELAQIVAAEPEPGIVKPSYWKLLCTYLRPGACRPAIALVGPAGNGKTTAAEEAMRVQGIEFIVIDANVSMEPVDLVGGMTYKVENGVGRQVWADGPVTKAFREGKGVIINEFDTLDPRTALCLQSAFQGKGSKVAMRYITLAGNPEEDRVHPAGDCPIILTMNTYGSGATRQYVGRNALDAATRDRLTIISTGYENEAQILQHHGYAQNAAQAVTSWAETTRRKIDQTAVPVILSIRTMLAICELIGVGFNLMAAADAEFWGALAPEVAEVLR